MPYHETDKACSTYRTLLFLKLFSKNFAYTPFMLVFYLEKELSLSCRILILDFIVDNELLLNVWLDIVDLQITYELLTYGRTLL